jgi:hypothetical protein
MRPAPNGYEREASMPVPFCLPRGSGPGREQNLLISDSRHLYLLKDGTLRYQQKELDARTAGARTLITRYVLLDVDTGVVYGECRPAGDKDLAGFLARAWHVKPDHPMQGLPEQLNIPQLVREDSDYWADMRRLVAWGGFRLDALPGGFAAGIHAVKRFEQRVESTLHYGPDPGVDIDIVQRMSALISSTVGDYFSRTWTDRWRERPPAPPEFFSKIDALYTEPGGWRRGEFAGVLQGLMKDGEPIDG